jgi:hypothetical protein
MHLDLWPWLTFRTISRWRKWKSRRLILAPWVGHPSNSWALFICNIPIFVGLLLKMNCGISYYPNCSFCKCFCTYDSILFESTLCESITNWQYFLMSSIRCRFKRSEYGSKFRGPVTLGLWPTRPILQFFLFSPRPVTFSTRSGGPVFIIWKKSGGDFNVQVHDKK